MHIFEVVGPVVKNVTTGTEYVLEDLFQALMLYEYLKEMTERCYKLEQTLFELGMTLPDAGEFNESS